MVLVGLESIRLTILFISVFSALTLQFVVGRPLTRTLMLYIVSVKNLVLEKRSLLKMPSTGQALLLTLHRPNKLSISTDQKMRLGSQAAILLLVLVEVEPRPRVSEACM